MAFLSVWLCGWTVGGMSAFTQLSRGFQPFIAFWLCAWALGEVFVVATLAWMSAGRETLRVVGSDLEIAAEILGYARRRRYRGADIRAPSSSQYVRAYSNGRSRTDMPMIWSPVSGGVKFVYGARTIYAGVGLDEPEGRLIVDLLKRRLPKSATEPA